MNLVIVEDSAEVRNRLIELVQSRLQPVVVDSADTEKEAILLILRTSPDAVLLDITLAEGSGLRVLEVIRQMHCRARVIMMTALAHPAYRRLCRTLGADDFWDKSTSPEALLDSLGSCMADCGQPVGAPS